MCLWQCCSLDLLAKLLRCSLVIKGRIGCWSLRVEPCLLQLPPHVPSIPTHQETGLGMELEKIGSALKAVQSFEPELYVCVCTAQITPAAIMKFCRA